MQRPPMRAKGSGKNKGGKGSYDEEEYWEEEQYDSYPPMNDRGGGKGSAEYSGRDAPMDRCPRVAEKLSVLRASLPEQAALVYHALQLALQPHSRPNGSRPHFEKDFHDSLSALFPNALNIMARQIGSWNQWELSIDDGPSMFCSVRLEVLSDDPQFVKDLKAKARVVKNTLLGDDGHWKKQLGATFNFEKLAQFEQECGRNSNVWEEQGGEKGKGKGGGGGDAYGNRKQVWVEKQLKCETCKKSMEEDVLAGQHMCVVVGSFSCPQCRSSWTSYHARLKPDSTTVMGQQCKSCNCAGLCKEWRVDTQDESNRWDNESSYSEKPKRGMHQSEFCEACREFGNCMGVFYDPFVLTTALSLVSGHTVQWKSFSEELPELLIANLGPQLQDLQVCLQPHVYIPPEHYQQTSSGLGEHQQQAFNNDAHRYTRGDVKGGRGEFNDPCYDRHDEHYGQYQRQGPSGEQQQFDNQQNFGARDRELGYHGQYSEVSGVTSPDLFDSFLNKVGAGQDYGGTHNNPQGPNFDGGQEFVPGAQGFETTGAVGAHGQSQFASQGMQRRQNVPSVPKGPPPPRRGELGTNKIGSHTPTIDTAGHGQSSFSSASGSGYVQPPPAMSQTSQQPVTPLLDSLPPLRRTQFLQNVLRQVKVCGGNESDKFQIAEDFLATSNDYDHAYQTVKTLTADRMHQSLRPQQ